ncbi:MAG: hypothetical protein V2I97_12810 [Desulfococcaceae bacterium]|jgi:hypothetical protein|nr:hypothetical protein [Desulfococcaceae bacterium]
MNTSAIKKMEIMNSLSRIRGGSLDKIKEYIDSFLTESDISKPDRGSLKGIWKDKGFERIADLDTELKNIRQEMGNSILERKF